MHPHRNQSPGSNGPSTIGNAAWQLAPPATEEHLWHFSVPSVFSLGISVPPPLSLSPFLWVKKFLPLHGVLASSFFSWQIHLIDGRMRNPKSIYQSSVSKKSTTAALKMSLQAEEAGMRTCREIKATVRYMVTEIDTWIAAQTGYGVSQREIRHPFVYVDTCICNLISLERAERFIVSSLSQLQFSSDFVQSVKTGCAVYAHNSARRALERGLNELELTLKICCWTDHYVDELEEELEDLDGHGQRGFGAIPATDAAIMRALNMIIFKKGAEEESSCDCVICMDEIPKDTQAWQMPCLHLFHRECIVNWLRQSNCCPICRFRLQESVA